MSRLSIICVLHFRICFFLHIPNQSRDATEAFFNKKMGVYAGAADLLLAWKGGQGFIELKTQTGKLSNNQNRFLSAFSALGWHTGVCRTVKEVHMMLCSWGLQPHHHSVMEPDLRSDDQKKSDAFDFYKS